MIQKTNDLTQFKFRKDNRNVDDTPHLKKIIESIKKKNLLHLCPILVNEKMEVIDGQHRLQAAKHLGLEIHYEISKKSEPIDMVLLNISKPWGLADFLNYFVQNRHDEYVKFNEFIRKNQISVILGLQILYGRSSQLHADFKMGKLKFIEEDSNDMLQYCKDTIKYIRSQTSNSTWTGSTKFFIALCQLYRFPKFNKEKWFNNLKYLVKSCKQHVNKEDYYQMLFEILENPTLNYEENKGAVRDISMETNR